VYLCVCVCVWQLSYIFFRRRLLMFFGFYLALHAPAENFRFYLFAGHTRRMFT